MALPDHTLSLPDDWVLDILPGPAVLPRPVFTLDRVRIGLMPSDPACAAHIAKTQGSSCDWGDEWRFAREPPVELCSLYWVVPEFNAPGPPARLPPSRPAKLGLRQAGREGSVTRLRDFTPERLVCLWDDAPATDSAYEVAPGLCVLAAGNTGCGWALLRPLDALEGGPAPPALGPLVMSWYALVCDDTLDALYDQDAALHAEIARLRDEIRALSHPAAEGVAAYVDGVLQNFYGS